MNGRAVSAGNTNWDKHGPLLVRPDYEIMIIGDSCVIDSIPRVKGLVGFATRDSPRRSSGGFYYSPNGADLSRTVRLIEMGFDGDGFRR